MAFIKRAILLAAGVGERLKPVTLEIPKPLIQVNGTRIMDRCIAALRKNGIEEIIIVVGYRKEKFWEIYGKEPDIKIIDNPYYQQGNNITSAYLVREYLPDSFVVESDILVGNETIFDRNIEKSGYMATWMQPAPEWLLELEGGRIVKCDKEAGRAGYRLWGISMWTHEDGIKLAGDIQYEFEIKKNWDIYWDEVALFRRISEYSLGVKEISGKDVCEIDTLDELVKIDSTYGKYL